MLEFRPSSARSIRWVWWLILTVIALGVLVPLALSVRTWWGARSLQYRLDPETVSIRYAPATIRIPRSQITRAYVLERPGQPRRIAGTGMPGFYQGHWSFAETGSITLYDTAQSMVVVLETPSGKWGITPQDPAGFLQALGAGKVGAWAPVAAGGFPWAIMLPFIEVLVIAPILWAVRLFMPDPASIRYALDHDSLVISGGKTRVAVPYGTITAVTVADPAGRPLKAWGAAMPGLYWGSFIWKQAGPNLKLYATQVKPLVLIKTGHSTYGVSPEEPERFTAELTRRLQG